MGATLFWLMYPVPRESANLSFTPLDVSWVYGLNLAAAQGWRFGTDILFTYGPLAYLYYPLDLNAHVVASLVFWLTLNAALATLVVYVLTRGLSTTLRVAFCAAVFLGVAINTELELVFVVLLALSMSFEHRKAAALGATAAAVASLALLIKFTIGVMVLSSLLIWAWLQWRENRLSIVRIATVVAVFPAATFGIYLVVGGQPGDFIPFLRGSLEFANGYSAAMMSGGWVAGLVVGLLAIVALFTVALRADSPAVRRAAWLSLAPLFLTFKQGFVRADIHHVIVFLAFGFYVAAVLIGSVLDADAPGAADRKTALLALTLAAVIFAAIAISFGARPSELLRGDAGLVLTQPADLLRNPPFRGFRASARAHLAQTASYFALPAEIRGEVSGQTVDILPWDAGYAAANSFEWRPRPVFQSYAVYTMYLDEINMRHYQRANAPRFVVFEPKSLDGYHPFFYEPGTWREIMCRYALQRRLGGIFLLEHASQASCETTPISAFSSALGMEILLPAEQRGIFAAFEVRPSLLGRAAAVMFRTPPIGLDMRYADGSRFRFRFNAATAGRGLALGYLPLTSDDVELVLRGMATREVTAISVVTEGSWAYSSKMHVRLFRLGN